jgi:hypothetical protein
MTSNLDLFGVRGGNPKGNYVDAGAEIGRNSIHKKTIDWQSEKISMTSPHQSRSLSLRRPRFQRTQG